MDIPQTKPPTVRAAMAMAKAQAYQDAADAPSTLRAYASDLKNFEAWCARHGMVALPATPDVVGAYLAAAGEGYAMQTLRRRVAAIARASGVGGHPLDTKHPAIRETLRGIGRTHGSRGRRSAALTTARPRRPGWLRAKNCVATCWCSWVVATKHTRPIRRPRTLCTKMLPSVACR